MYIWGEDMLGYLSADIICYSKKRTVNFKEQMMSNWISSHIVVPNGRYCVYYPSNLFLNACSFENWGIFGYCPVLAGGYLITWRGKIRPIARERKHLTDYKILYSKTLWSLLMSSAVLHKKIDCISKKWGGYMVLEKGCEIRTSKDGPLSSL